MTPVKYSPKVWINVVIMIAIMIVVGMLPPVGQITPLGMKVLGVLLGTIYAWIVLDTLWPSLFGFVALSLTGYTSVLGGLATALSNPTIIMILFGATFAGLIAKTDCVVIINKWLLTRKLIRRSPWNLIIALILFQVVASICNGGMAALFIGWEMIIQLTEECGYEKKSPLTSYLIACSVFPWVMTGNCFPFKAGSIAYLGFFEPTVGTAYEYIPYIVLSFLNLFIFIGLMLLFGKFILRLDVSKLKVSDEKIKELEQIETDNLQKTGLLAAVVFIVLMLLPSFLPKEWYLTIILSKFGLVGIVIILLSYFACLRDENNKPIIDIGQCISYVPWSVLWILAFAMPLGDAMKSADCGIMTTISTYFTPLFSGMSPLVFMIAAMVFLGLLTQVLNNMVAGAMFIPIFTQICLDIGGNPWVFFLMLMIPLNCAYLTPAGSLQGAMIHGNPNVDKKYAYILAAAALIATFIACICLIPLGNLFW